MADTVGKSIRCRAAVMREHKKPLVVETIDVAPPRAGEVRIKMMYASICHSDENYLSGVRPWKINSVIGHEGAGIVESVGEGVTAFKAGDHVIPIFVSQCRKCRACKSGKTNICDEHRSDEYREGCMLDGTSRFSCNGEPVYHYLNVSTFSQYTVVPERVLVKINPSAPLDKMPLMGCGIATGYGSAVNTAKVERGSVCAVWGLGTIGLAAVMGCKRAGASRIIGIDLNPEKFELGKKFGLTEGLNPKDYDKPIDEVIREKTSGGLDYAFECIGNIHTVRAAFESCHRGYGKTLLIGITPTTVQFSTDTFAITMGRQVLGSLFGGYKVDDIAGLVEEYMRKEILVDDFVTGRMGLDDINKGFELLRQGKGLRTVIDMWK